MVFVSLHCHREVSKWLESKAPNCVENQITDNLLVKLLKEVLVSQTQTQFAYPTWSSLFLSHKGFLFLDCKVNRGLSVLQKMRCEHTCTFRNKLQYHVNVKSITEVLRLLPSTGLLAGSTAWSWGFLQWLREKESTCNAGGWGDVGSVPGWGRSPGRGHGNSHWCSCLKNPVDRGAWWAVVHGVSKGRKQLKQCTTAQDRLISILCGNMLSNSRIITKSVELSPILWRVILEIYPLCKFKKDIM